MAIHGSLAIAQQAYGFHRLHMEHIRHKFMSTGRRLKTTSCWCILPGAFGHVKKPKRLYKECWLCTVRRRHKNIYDMVRLNGTRVFNLRRIGIRSHQSWSQVDLFCCICIVFTMYLYRMRWNYLLKLDHANHDHMLTFPSLLPQFWISCCQCGRTWGNCSDCKACILKKIATEMR